MRCQLSKKRLVIGSIIATFLMLGILIFSCFLAINPYDRVRVTVLNLTFDTEFVCLVSESNGILHNMNFYPRSELLVPFIMEPSDCILARPIHNANSRIATWTVYVQWRSGEWYGIVTMETGDKWRVTLFPADEVQISDRYFIFGNRVVHFDINKGTTFILTEAQQTKLRLRKSW